MKVLTPNLMVENIRDTITFYKDILGFEVLMALPKDKPIWALLKSGNVTVMLQERKSFEDEFAYMKGKSLCATLSLYIRMDKVEEYYSKIKDKVSIIKVPHTTPYKMKEFAIQDCNGYLLVFAQEL